MGRVVILLLYYFLIQLCVTFLSIAAYFGWYYVGNNSFPDGLGMPFGFTLTANIVSIVLMSWILLRYKYFTLTKENINPGRPKNVLIYLAICITAMIWMNFISDMMSLPDWFKSTFSMMQESMWGIITMSIIAPIFEEMFFRGAIEGYLLEKWKNPRYAILVSALIFGLIHLNPAQVLFAFAFGLILGEVYYRTRSITAVIIMHFINNTVSVITMIMFPECDTLTDILGFNNMAIASAISVVLFFFLYRFFVKTNPK